MMDKLKRIAVIGPESTGKSTLSEQLASQYGTLWCPEFARSYLHGHGRAYDYDSLLTIAKGQLELEEHHAAQAVAKWNKREDTGSAPSPLLFVDTEMYVMKVWCEFVFGKCHPWILDRIAERRYDLYLLCHTDLPWERDELREYPDPAIRKRLLRIYRDHLVNQGTPWIVVMGSQDERLEAAIDAVDASIHGTHIGV